MMKLFRTGIALLLVLVMALSLTACGGGNDATEPSTEATTAPTETTEATTAPTVLENPVENPVTYFSMTLAQTADNYDYLNAYDDGMGGIYVEYVGDFKKVGTFDATVMDSITTELEKTQLADLAGQDVYEDGEATGSMYIEYADGSALTFNFAGTIPQEYLDGYAAMDAFFQNLTAELEEYVPQAQVMGEVNPDALTAMQDILNNSGMEGLDMLYIEDVPVDEFFHDSVNLSSSEGIVNATKCSHMMMTTPYSIVIVTVDNAENIQTVRDDFEQSMNWQKWVCVQPANALIAHKDNMVICVMGDSTMFSQTATAVENAGWSEVKTLDNPDM